MATDKHRFAQIIQKSVCIRVHLWLIPFSPLCLCGECVDE